jgi:hypothetical protein
MPQPLERQTLMFSATFPPQIQAKIILVFHFIVGCNIISLAPLLSQRLARDFGHDYVFVTIGRVGSTVNLITRVMPA